MRDSLILPTIQLKEKSSWLFFWTFLESFSLSLPLQQKQKREKVEDPTYYCCDYCLYYLVTTSSQKEKMVTVLPLSKFFLIFLKELDLPIQLWKWKKAINNEMITCFFFFPPQWYCTCRITYLPLRINLSQLFEMRHPFHGLCLESQMIRIILLLFIFI